MRSPNETAPETRNRSSKWPVTVRGRLINTEKELHNKRGTISFCAHWLLNSMDRVYGAAEQSSRKKTKKNTPPWCGEVKRAPGFQLPSSPHWARRQAVAFQKGDKTLATALLSGKRHTAAPWRMQEGARNTKKNQTGEREFSGNHQHSHRSLFIYNRLLASLFFFLMYALYESNQH